MLPTVPPFEWSDLKERGVLFLYPIDPDSAGKAAGLPPDLPPIIGFAVSLPKSKSGTSVKYRVNNVYWTQEHGDVD